MVVVGSGGRAGGGGWSQLFVYLVLLFSSFAKRYVQYQYNIHITQCSLLRKCLL